MVDPIRDGFDVVFGTGPLQDSTLIARKVFDPDLFLCASTYFVQQLPTPLDEPTQLNGYPFELSSSTSITAFYEAARDIFVENIARDQIATALTTSR